MSESIQRLIENKRAHRSKLAALPFEEMIKLLEKMRQHTLSIQAARNPGLEAALLEGVRSPHVQYDTAVIGSDPAERIVPRP